MIFISYTHPVPLASWRAWADSDGFRQPLTARLQVTTSFADDFAARGPRDPQGTPGAYEAALQGHKMADPNQPIEILRTIHSFDPCIACAVHVTDPDGEEMVQVKLTPA